MAETKESGMNETETAYRWVAEGERLQRGDQYSATRQTTPNDPAAEWLPIPQRNFGKLFSSCEFTGTRRKP